MNRDILQLVALPIFIAVAFTGCAESEPRTSVSEETLYSAQEARFPYKRRLAKAEQGDAASLQALLRFDKVDAAGALWHGVVLVELGNIVGDAKLSESVRRQPDAVRERIREYLEFGVAYATNPEQKKPLPEQFPLTTKVLNGE